VTIQGVFMHTADMLALPARELDILRQIERWKSGLITQGEASCILRLSERQLRRLIRRYECYGPKGLCHGRHGKQPSNKLDDELREKSLTLIQAHFHDYGPTLASEKLGEYFGIKISKETVRQWMIKANLWQAKQKRVPRPHPPRARRPFLGELVQVDGSHHHWFEERGPKACLLVFIDDATGELLNLRFAPGETTIDYMAMLKEYVLERGAPRAMYFDKHNVFHINQKAAKAQDGLTQFGRVLKHLTIEPIYAHSPQAKGRVERVNETLQDRLLKELRFFEINDIESANKHVKGFIKRFNTQFAQTAQEPVDVHRPLSEKEKASLDYHCSIQTTRTISKDLLVKHNRMLFKITSKQHRPRQLINHKVMICEDANNTRFYFNGQLIHYQLISKPISMIPTLNRKNVDQYLDSQAKLKHYWMLRI
jgi:transposase